MESYIQKFHEEKIDLELLMVLSDQELNDTFGELRLPIGDKVKIRRGIKQIREQGENIMILYI